MGYKTLHMGNNLEENVFYERKPFPIAACVDRFDDYLNRAWGIHWHSEYEFGFVTKGEVQFTLQYCSEEKTFLLCEGDGIFINSEILHSAVAAKPDTQIAEIVFKPSFFGLLPLSKSTILSVSESLPLYQSNDRDRELLETMKMIGRLNEEKDGYELYCIEVVCKLWRMLAERMEPILRDKTLSGRNRVPEERIKLLLSYIQNHYAETISSEEMAKAVNISRTECFRLFKTFLKKTPADYLTEYRFTRAVNLLTNTDKTVTEIAFGCGFKNPSYFCKIFKDKFGVTPTLFRNENA